MTYLVTARKWRPMVFEDVVGQSHVATTLRNAIATNRLSHAYLFSGPRGVGKTTTARLLAKAINCQNPKESNPDNECTMCQEITESRSIDVLEIDGASNRGVDEIRNLRESVRYAPARGKTKVYIIDEVHMLTKEAFNALLKTLEEPPPHILFIFATTEVHKVPATILSRCQRFDFRRISIEEIVQRLRFIADQEHVPIDNDALLIIAKKADGSLRDAQSIFDQVVSFSGDPLRIDAQHIMHALNVVNEELYFRVNNLIHTKDGKGGLALVEEIMSRGYDIKEFLSGLNEHFRNMLIVLTMQSSRLVETSEAFKKRYEEEAQYFSESDVFRFMKIVSDISASLRWSDQPRFRLEIGLLQMIKMDSSLTIEKLLQELEELKKKAGIAPTNQHDFKILGSVKASPPTRIARPSASGAWLSPPPAAQHLPQPLTSNEFEPREGARTDFSTAAAAPYPSSRGVSMTPVNQPPSKRPLEQFQEKWRTFVEAATRQKVMIGTALQASQVVSVSGDTLRVGCPDDVHLSMLKRSREFLTELAQQIYGAKVRFETILAAQQEEKTPQPEHPIISALKRELGATPIE